MFASFEKVERRPVSDSRIEFQQLNPSPFIKKPFDPGFGLRNELLLGKRLSIQPLNSHCEKSNPITVMPYGTDGVIKSNMRREYPNFQAKTFTNFKTRPKILGTPSTLKHSSQDLRKSNDNSTNSLIMRDSLLRSANKFDNSRELSISLKRSSTTQVSSKNSIKQEMARISYLQEKMTRNECFKTSASHKRKPSLQKAQTTPLDLTPNPSSIFLQEMENKELEENEVDQSLDMSFSELENRKSNEILLVRSIYQNRPPTIFFKYPQICGFPQDLSKVFKVTESEIKDYDLNCRITGEKPLKCVQLALQAGGFDITTEGKNWNLFWGFVRPETLKNMNRYQKTNHFPGCWHLGRKDNMYRHVLKMKQRFGEQYDFIPKTYLLSNEFKRFNLIRQNSDNKALWIMKPVNSACGRGVKVIDKKTKLEFKKDYLVSEYINNPHLLNGLKYDLRVYVLITSFDPLRVYCFKEGLVRFATEKYSLSKKKLKKRFVHLTNYSVNKKALKYKRNMNVSSDDEGSKWSFSAYRRKLQELEINGDELFGKVHDLIIKVCISVESHVLHSINRLSDHRNNCFELFGFDVLIDANLKPWLMEVNVSPSLSSSSPLDARIKTTLMSDIFNLVGFRVYDKKKIGDTKMGQEDKKITGGDKNYNLLNASNCLKMLTTENWNVLFENEEENCRKGQFERIFPKRENIEFYSQFFENPSSNNVIWWQLLKSETDFLEMICKREKIR